jgi:hypothetical protein
MTRSYSLEDPTIWLSVLCAGLLIVVLVGVLLAMRYQRRRGQRGTSGSITDWGQSLALTYELRREIKRLSEENRRLTEERVELVKVFGHVAECLQQEVSQILQKSLGPKSETTSRTRRVPYESGRRSPR